VATLRKRAERAEAVLVKARQVIDVQGNVSALLGLLRGPSVATSSRGTTTSIATPASA